MAHDRVVAGIRCFEVLAHLSDYIDDELSPARRAQVDAHLADCDWCAKFGGAVAETVEEIRSTLREPSPAPEGVRERLQAALIQRLDDVEADSP